MKRAILAAAWLALLPGAVAHAGADTDALTQCLAKSAAPADQAKLMQWMFSLIALNPAVKANAQVTPQQREAFDRQAAGLIQRLLTVDCRGESVAALKTDGASAIEASFRVMQELAVRGLINDPAVGGGVSTFTAYIDQDKLADLGREAGIPDQRDRTEK